LEFYNVDFRFDVNDVNLIKSTKIRSLTVHSNFYYWILKTYGPDSKNTQKCFEDIIESRIWIDVKLQEFPEKDVPEHLTSCAFNSICSIFIEFCNEKVPFKRKYLAYLQLANNDEIIKPLFEISLPKVFGLEINVRFPLEITYGYNRPEVRLINNNKRKYNVMNNMVNQQKHEMKKWFKSLRKMYYLADNSNITQNFKNSLEEFQERITSSQNLEIQSLINDENNENDNNDENDENDEIGNHDKNDENNDEFYTIEQPIENASKRIKH